MNARLTYLYQRYIDDACSKEEREELLSIIAENPENDTIVSLLDNTWDKIGNEKLIFPAAGSILHTILSDHPKPIAKKISWYRYAAAASIIICIGIGFYFYQKDSPTPAEITTKNDIAPGGNKAFLTLADGKRIVLTDAKVGELAQQSGVKITKAADGQLIYTVSNLSNGNDKVKGYNTIETPNGGQYQIQLPDGTKVWLNAASSLKYPSKFARLVNRRVELLRGEAYFEVVKDKAHPFIVKSNQQEVEVLGTHFNINTYLDERSVKTTLLEGSVKVITLNGFSKTLIPGQQSQITKTNISIIKNIDLEDVTAWKNGYFKFSESLESIMNKVSRWYDVDIVYETKPNSSVFNGKISRNRSLKELLNMLEFAGDVHFKIEGRRVIVQR